MEFELLGLPADGPTLDLDHERFAYAGKFVTPRTGKTVVRDGRSVVGDGGTVVGAVAFSEDYARSGAVRLRYVTVREDRRGEGLGPRLLRFTAHALADEFETVLIAVNNPVAYQACYRAGFVSTGEETGIAELLLRYAPEAERSRSRYREGFEVFRGRDLPEAQQAVVSRHANGSPPPIISCPE